MWESRKRCGGVRCSLLAREGRIRFAIADLQKSPFLD